MANEQQIQQMLNLMQKQMEQLEVLRVENSQLMTNAVHQPPTQTTPQQQRPKTKAPDRPVINANTDEREWELFKDSWNRYKLLAGITDDNLLRMELRASCSQDVNRLLFEYVGASTLDTNGWGDDHPICCTTQGTSYPVPIQDRIHRSTRPETTTQLCR